MTVIQEQRTVHNYNIRRCCCEPSGKHVLIGNVRGEISSVSFVFSVIGKATALGRQSTDKVDVGLSCIN